MSAAVYIDTKDSHEGDSQLMERLASGDVSALGSLYDKYAEQVLRFARRSAPAADAEDIMQTTFVRLAAVANRYSSDRGSVRAFIFGVTINVVREQRRSVARFAKALSGLVSENKSRPILLSPKRADSLDIERALRKLSDAKRIPLLLVEVEGFRCEEVAEMMDVPVGTVWTRLHHARKQLRELLAKGEKR